MTPVQVWTLLAAIGAVFALWNLLSTLSDRTITLRAMTNGQRRIIVESHLALNGCVLLGCLMLGSLGVELMLAGQGSGGSWNRITITIIGGVAVLILTAIVLRITRIRLNRYRRNNG